MKKIVSLLMIMLIIVGVAGCKNSKTNEGLQSSTDNISNYVSESVSKGKIPELEFSLGSSIDELEAYFNKTKADLEQAHNEGGEVFSNSDFWLNKNEGELSVTYEINNVSYYYEKAKSDKGISVICSISDAFGIKLGTNRTDVEAMLSDLELKSLTAGEDELYFVPLTEALILIYKSGSYVADFYFNNNELVATVIKDTNNWTL